MHYVQYLPGTAARITEQPTRHGHKDVNWLSREVVKFNRWLTAGGHYKHNAPVAEFVRRFKEFQL